MKSTSKTPSVKLKKGQFLYFVSMERLEEIKKSSNNEKEGMLRTFYAKLKREKEYTVKHVLSGIADGTIKLYESSQVKDGQLVKTQDNA